MELCLLRSCLTVHCVGPSEPVLYGVKWIYVNTWIMLIGNCNKRECRFWGQGSRQCTVEYGGVFRWLKASGQGCYLWFQVQLHVSPARIVGVFLQDEAQRRLALVQIAVFQQEELLHLGTRNQLVFHLTVSTHTGYDTKPQTLSSTDLQTVWIFLSVRAHVFINSQKPTHTHTLDHRNITRSYEGTSVVEHTQHLLSHTNSIQPHTHTHTRSCKILCNYKFNTPVQHTGNSVCVCESDLHLSHTERSKLLLRNESMNGFAHSSHIR